MTEAVGWAGSVRIPDTAVDGYQGAVVAEAVVDDENTLDSV